MSGNPNPNPTPQSSASSVPSLPTKRPRSRWGQLDAPPPPPANVTQPNHAAADNQMPIMTNPLLPSSLPKPVIPSLPPFPLPSSSAAASASAPLSSIEAMKRQVAERLKSLGMAANVKKEVLSASAAPPTADIKPSIALLVARPASVALPTPGPVHVPAPAPAPAPLIPIPATLDELSSSANARRSRNYFSFVNPGKYTALAESLRSTQTKSLLPEIRDAPMILDYEKIFQWSKTISGAGAGSGSMDDDGVDGQSGGSHSNEILLDWWDSQLVDSDIQNGSESNHSHTNNHNSSSTNATATATATAITSNIYHPIPFQSPYCSIPDAVPLPYYLTKRERRKLKRRQKSDARNAQIERIQLGLEKPPDPKYRISNLLNSLLSESVAAPSSMELDVLNQMEQRKSAHEARNAANTLNKDQRREKRRKKYAEDNSLYQCIYTVGALHSKRIRIYLEQCGEFYSVTGVGIVCAWSNCKWNYLFIEGGKRGLKAMERELKRIVWKENGPKMKTETENENENESQEVTAVKQEHGQDSVKAEGSATEADTDAVMVKQEPGAGSDSDSSDSDSDSDFGSDSDPSNASQTHRKRVASPYFKRLWFGIPPQRYFSRFFFEFSRDATQARRLMKNAQAEHLWDLAIKETQDPIH